MKPKLLALSAAIILLTSVNSYAGNGYFTEVFRNLGYFYGDGYHARRYCLPDYKSCSDCSPVQQPEMLQPMMPQPMMQRSEMQQPMMAPGYSRWAPSQFSPTSYPVTQTYQPWFPSYAPGYDQPVTPSVAIPNPRRPMHW